MSVSKLRSSAVAECGVGPSLVQVTVSPTLIVTEAGANWKSLIVTPVSAAAVARGALRGPRGLAWARVRCAAGAESAAGCEAGVSGGAGSPAPAASGTAVPGGAAPEGAAPAAGAPEVASSGGAA